MHNLFRCNFFPPCVHPSPTPSRPGVPASPPLHAFQATPPSFGIRLFVSVSLAKTIEIDHSPSPFILRFLRSLQGRFKSTLSPFSPFSFPLFLPPVFPRKRSDLRWEHGGFLEINAEPGRRINSAQLLSQRRGSNYVKLRNTGEHTVNDVYVVGNQVCHGQVKDSFQSIGLPINSRLTKDRARDSWVDHDPEN